MGDAVDKRNSVKRRRDKLRAMGLRPLQIWVQDTKAPGFAAEALRQSRVVGRGAESREAQDWINGNSVLADDSDE
jgi:hypothetical protein